MTKPSFGWVITAAAENAEDAGNLPRDNQRFIEKLSGKFEMIWVEDHLQWDDRPVLECWTALVFLASRYPEFKFGPLVFGQSYRNPALTAKMFSTLYWLTEGRMVAGIGAGWKEDEYLSYGWPYPAAETRIGELEDAVQIIRKLWTESPATFKGKYFQIEEAYCEPMPSPPPPLLIAGGGEQLTLKLVAKYGDWMNVGFCKSEVYAQKLEALRGHCTAIGRDYDEIKKSYFAFVSINEDEFEPPGRSQPHLVMGNAQEVTKEFKQFIDLGVEHFMIRFVDFPSTKGLELFLDKVMPQLS